MTTWGWKRGASERDAAVLILRWWCHELSDEKADEDTGMKGLKDRRFWRSMTSLSSRIKRQMWLNCIQFLKSFLERRLERRRSSLEWILRISCPPDQSAQTSYITCSNTSSMRTTDWGACPSWSLSGSRRSGCFWTSCSWFTLDWDYTQGLYWLSWETEGRLSDVTSKTTFECINCFKDWSTQSVNQVINSSIKSFQ